MIVHGDADGADRIADNFASSNGVDRVKMPANWRKHGKAAGPIRNASMLKLVKPTHYVAFKGGRGTADMIAKCEANGVKCLYNENEVG